MKGSCTEIEHIGSMLDIARYRYIRLRGELSDIDMYIRVVQDELTKSITR